MVAAVAVLPPPAKVPLGPLEGAMNVTVTPLTGWLLASVTVAVSAVPNVVVTGALWGVPPVAAIAPRGAGVLVSEKFAVVETPATEAITMKLPVEPFAVRTGEVAFPDASVAAVAVFVPPVKAPLAPLPGAVNVTVTPLTGFPPASFTAATSRAPKAVLICAFCCVPLATVMDAGEPGMFFSAKAAVTATPGAEAITV